jgi:ribose/xylose/arabinose/galactoside ABC-type transport system permease subunit
VEGSAAESSTAPPDDTPTARPALLARLRGRARRLGWLSDLAMLPALIVLIVVLSVMTDGLLTSSNLTNVLSQSAVVAIAAIGATFVILTGGIDLSTGSVIGASGVAGAWIITSSGNLAVGVAAGLVTGTVIGLVVGAVVARLNVVPFAVTLAALYVVSGCTTLLSHGRTIAPMPIGFIRFSIDGPGGVPYAVWLAVALYVVAQIVLTRTAWGRRVVHVGANVEVARISGVNVVRTTTTVYAVAGLFSAIAGMVLTSGLAGAGASMGSPLLLNIVGAVVLGGTRLSGGRGSLLRTGIGVLFMGFLSNGMSLLGLQSFDQQIVTGSFIFAAASADGLLRWLGRRRPHAIRHTD